MPIMLSKTYAAFKAAGVSEAEAQAAAEEIALYETRFAKIEADLALVKWMVAGLYALAAPSLWLLLRIATKVGGVG